MVVECRHFRSNPGMLVDIDRTYATCKCTSNFPICKCFTSSVLINLNTLLQPTNVKKGLWHYPTPRRTVLLQPIHSPSDCDIGTSDRSKLKDDDPISHLLRLPGRNQW